MRLILYILLAWQMFRLVIRRKLLRVSVATFFLVLYAVVAYLFNIRMNPYTMFRMQASPVYAGIRENKVAPGKLVLGLDINGEAKAYPIEIIAHHHQLMDEVGRKRVWITYCSLCRTGRVYVPEVKNEETNFRVIGVDKYNAMFEDDITGSWWQQATGIAVAGPMKGAQLQEVPAYQMTLEAWLALHPASTVLQADSAFLKEYGQLTGYDEGSIDNDLESRQDMPWQPRAWVAVAGINDRRRAYDWNALEKEHLLQDTLGGKPIAIVLETDDKSVHGFIRRINNRTVQLQFDPASAHMLETGTGNIWNLSGSCIEGPDSSAQMEKFPVYQEFYHAYQNFRKDK